MVRRLSDRRPRPALSVVVPVYNTLPYLRECFDSLQAQTFTDLEILVVDDGSSDGSGAWLDERARLEPRMRVVHQKNRGLGAARNRAIRMARGEMLTFLDPDDVLPDEAYQDLVASLRSTGSAFVVGGVERFENIGDDLWTPAWSQVAHERARRSVTIRQAPRTLFDIVACNRVVRRDVWDNIVKRFPENVVYEDHLPILRLYLEASSFDVLPVTTYLWRRRADESSLGQHKHELQNLRDRVHAKWQGLAEVERHGSAVVRRWYVTRVLAVDLPPFVRAAAEPEADGAYVEAVAQFARLFVGLAERDRRAWRHVEPHQQVMAWLAASGQREQLEWFVAMLLERGKNHLPARADRGEVRLGASRSDWSVPDHLGCLDAESTTLRTMVVRAARRDDTIVLRLRVRIRRAPDSTIQQMDLALTTGMRRVPGRVRVLGARPGGRHDTVVEGVFALADVQAAVSRGRSLRLVGSAVVNGVRREVSEVETTDDSWRKVLISHELVARHGRAGFVIRRPPRRDETSSSEEGSAG